MIFIVALAAVSCVVGYVSQSFFSSPSQHNEDRAYIAEDANIALACSPRVNHKQMVCMLQDFAASKDVPELFIETSYGHIDWVENHPNRLGSVLRWRFALTPSQAGDIPIEFTFQTHLPSQPIMRSVLIERSFSEELAVGFPIALLTFTTVAIVWHFINRRRMREKRSEEKLEEAEREIKGKPEKATPAWDLARANLELYFERNRAHVGQVFLIAILIMFIGFGFVIYGVYLTLQNKSIAPSLVAGVSGIITQFIGATFMVIYRSTMSQANEFMTVLERINTVGMAVQILDSIPDEMVELKNKTRAHIVDLLLSSPASVKKQTRK